MSRCSVHKVLFRKKLAVLILAIVSASYSTEAQKNFKEAYLVVTPGDTLHGFVDNRDWEINPKSINFKTKLSETSKVYTPNNIQSFYIKETQELFIAHTLLIDKSPVSLTGLEEAKGLSKTETESLFLRVLIEGHLSLYFSYDFKNHFFLKKTDGSIQELLLQYKLTKKADGASAKIKFEKFKLQLSSLLNNCTTMFSKIENSQFTEKSLKALVLDYNKCQETTPTYVAPVFKPKFEFGAIGGMSHTTQDLMGDFARLTESPFSSSKTPTIGLFLNIVLPKKNESFSVYNELSYKYFSVKSEYVDENPSYKMVYTNYSNFSYVKYNAGVRYKIPFKLFRPYFQAGFATYLGVKRNPYTQRQHIDSGVVISSSIENYNSKKYEIGFWGALGLNVKKICIELRYEKPNGWTDAVGYFSNVNHSYILASYRFN